MLDARSGAVLQTVAVGSDPGPAVVARRAARVVVASGTTADEGRVSVLDATSGRLVCVMPLGATPLAVAVDERAGRAVVVTYGGIVRSPGAWWVGWAQGWRRWLPRLPPQFTSIRTVPGGVSVLDLSSL